MKGIISFITGYLFALGLLYGGMTQPHIVKGFLDVFGSWNPTLMGVMIGAISVHATAWWFIKKRTSPLLETEFFLPHNQKIDKKLIWGAILFGLGWGWVGICPGPAIVGLASGEKEFYYFAGSMFIGMKLYQYFEKRGG